MQFEPIYERNDLDAKLQEYEQGESGFSLDRVMKMIVKLSRVNDVQASSYCILPKKFQFKIYRKNSKNR